MAEEYVYEKPKENKKSKKRILAIFLIIIAVSVSSYILFNSSGIKNCGEVDYGSIISIDENDNCFKEAAKNCTPAKLIISASGGPIPFSILSEIKGFANDNTSCIVYDKTLYEKNGLPTLEDNCRIPIRILSKIDISPELRYPYCSGSLSEWFKQNIDQVIG